MCERLRVGWLSVSARMLPSCGWVTGLSVYERDARGEGCCSAHGRLQFSRLGGASCVLARDASGLHGRAK
jgi:hypothetical protein